MATQRPSISIAVGADPFELLGPVRIEDLPRLASGRLEYLVEAQDLRIIGFRLKCLREKTPSLSDALQFNQSANLPDVISGGLTLGVLLHGHFRAVLSEIVPPLVQGHKPFFLTIHKRAESIDALPVIRSRSSCAVRPRDSPAPGGSPA